MERLRRSRVFLVALAVVGACMLGCASKNRTVFLNPDANFEAVRRVALLPFDNFTNDINAPEKLRQILSIELLSARAFELVEAGEVRRALAESGIEGVANLSNDQKRSIGEKLEAQALMLGTIRELSLDRSSGVSAPTVSLHFELVDSQTGQTIWSTVVSRHGAGAAARLFGVGGTSMNAALREMVRGALRTLIR